MAQLRAKVTNLTEAIADGILRHSPSMAASLGACETELAGAEQELVVDSAAAAKVVEMVPRVAEQYRRMVEELPLVLRGSVREARREIGALLGGEVTMTPDETGLTWWRIRP